MPGQPGHNTRQQARLPSSFLVWGCYIRSDSFTDLHSLKKIEYKSSFIGNDYQTVWYLGKVVYNTTAYSLIEDFSVLLRVESCI